MQVSVFVDVRELSEKPQMSSPLPSIVRLHALDECISRNGNAREISLKTAIRQGKVVGDGRISLDANVEQEREFTAFVPSLRQSDLCGIELDKIERQVIEGRPDLIDHLSSQNCDTGRRLLQEIKFFCAIRLSGNTTRLTCGVIPNEESYRLDMYRCPDEFKMGRFEASNHASE
jgi:hypothetical protein